MPKLALLQQDDDNLFLEGKDGQTRNLPSNLYEQLADISDPYDPTKDFIGFVDPQTGVVLVDVETLENHHQTDKAAGTPNDEDDAKTPLTPSKASEIEDSEGKTSADDAELNAISPAPDAPPSPKKEKTLHHLAYEKKMGHPPPDDENRPISGFGVKKGRVVFNSSTFNSYDDEFHTEDRTMGETEQVKLTILICKLHAEYQKTTSSSMCTVL